MPRLLLARRLFPIPTAIGAAELLVRSPLDFSTPGLILFPCTLYVAYRYGLRVGLYGSALAVGYVLYFFQAHGGRIGPPDGYAWRVGIIVLGIPLVAVVLGMLRDRFDQLLVRERAARAEAEEARERTHSILESITDAFIVVDSEWRFRYMNATAERLLERDRSELLDTPAWEVLPQVLDSFFQKYNQARVEGGSVQFQTASLVDSAWYEVHAFPAEEGVTMYFRDVTERRHSEERLRSLSMVDELTGLYNRRGFIALAEQQCRAVTRAGRGLFLVFVDLDDFKQINDTFGHAVGDQALRDLSEILRHTFRESDVVGRLGGDEFAAVAVETRPGSSSIMLSRLRERVADYNAREGAQYQLSLSIGTARFEGEGVCDIEELLAHADRTMYRQKRKRQK